MRLISVFMLVVSLTLLVACGGGGGGSGASNSPPISPPTTGGTPVNADTLSLSGSSVSFSATQFETPPTETQTIRASFSGSNTAGLVVGTLPGVSSLPSWLSIEVSQVTANSGDITFRILSTDIPDGTLNFTVRAVTVDANENVLDDADITIQYVVAEGVPLSVTPQVINLVLHQNSEPVNETVSVTAGNYNWDSFGDFTSISPVRGTGSQEVALEIFPPPDDFLEQDRRFIEFVDFFAVDSSTSAFVEINLKVFRTLSIRNGALSFNAISGGAVTEVQV